MRTAWNDKFRVPTPDELREGLPKPLHGTFNDARERFGELEDATEQLVWQGVPWRWTFVYTEAPESRVLAYLIPDPSRLQICVPLAHEFIDRLPLKRMKKSIRDGVVFARQVNNVWWPTWDVPSKGALEEVFELIARKHAVMTGTESKTTVGV